MSGSVIASTAAPDAAVPDLGILSGPLAGGGPLVRDYLAGTPALAAFFAGHPSDASAYARKAAEVERRLDAAARGRLASAIEPLGDSADRLRRILGGDGFFVTTGQQPALFGGPLYTLYKTLAAVRLADVLERQLGRPVLALFWIGADDHDWDEANHASLIDARGELQTLRVRGPADAPLVPMSERRWGPGVVHAVDAFVRALPDGALTAEVARHVRDAYTPDSTVAESFTATFRLLLRDQRIALVSSADPALRRAAASVLRLEAERSDDHTARVTNQTARLEAAGYAAQVAVGDGASNLMLLDEAGRDRLIPTAAGWATRRERRTLSHAELLRLLDEAPERFSPNVLLRPVVENAILPTVAYVAGPGELRYYAQIACLFHAHDILPPVVVPRPAVTLVEPAVRRTLERLGLAPESFARPFDEVVADVVRSRLPASVAAGLERLRARIREGYAELMDAAAPVDPDLAGPLRAARNASLVRVAEAERRIARRFKRRNEELMGQLRRVAWSLRPEGAPQERILSPLPFLAKYGAGLVPAIAATLPLEPDGATQWTGPTCDG